MASDYSKNAAVEKTMQRFRSFAKENNIPIVILSQLNRKVEERTDKIPILADLRDSGSIEQDATQIIFLYRPHYYFPDASFTNIDLYCDDELLKYENILKAIVAKARGGETGSVILQYLKEIQRINNVEKRETIPEFPDEKEGFVF